MTRRAAFRQSDLTRAIRAAKACGARVVVRLSDGVVEINPAKAPDVDSGPPTAPQSTPATAYEQWKGRKDARHA